VLYADQSQAPRRDVVAEEIDSGTGAGALRRVFEELEAEFEAGLRREVEQESVAAIGPR
jgi:hypothetical protein